MYGDNWCDQRVLRSITLPPNPVPTGPVFSFIKYILPCPQQSHTEYVTKTKGIEGGREDERRNTRNRKVHGRNSHGHRSRKADI